MNRRRLFHLVLATLFSVVRQWAGAQTTVTVGNATTTVASASYHPYASYYTTSRVQFLILASELQAQGISSASNITSLAFNVSAVATGGATCTQGAGVSNGQVGNYSISLKNTNQGLPLTGYDLSGGFTNVYFNTLYTPLLGWNKHQFSSNFQWDGVSNILVDLCTANVGNGCNQYCYTANCVTYYTSTTLNSVFSGWADSQGSWCGTSFPNTCTFSPIGSGSTFRPNFQLTVASLSPPVAPSPNFQFTIGEDTLWAGASSVLINTSVNSIKNYWNVTAYSAASESGPWTTYYTYPKDTLQCNSWGCFLDTAGNELNLRYTFPDRGYYKVSLTTVNTYGYSAVEKVVFVDTPAAKPKAMFFATRRQLGVNDRVRLNNLSTNAPAKVKWWLINSCNSCGPDSNVFLPHDSALSPVLAAMNPGLYRVCLSATNAKGTDTFCRADYLNVLPGYLMNHNEPGRWDSVGKDPSGYLFSDLRTTDGAQLAGQFEPTPAPNKGFRIAPCADTIYLALERLRMRGNNGAGSDSVYVRLNGYNGPIVRRWGGNNINAVKDSLKVYKHIGQYLYITYAPQPSGGQLTVVPDSGFAIKWTSVSANYSKPVASFISADTLYSGYRAPLVNQSTGVNMSYAWDLNNDGSYGMENPIAADSTSINPSVVFSTLTPTTWKICLKVMNCQGEDTMCKRLALLPFSLPPVADFTTNRTTGLVTDTFVFSDQTRNGVLGWKWRFEPNTVTWLNGTDSTSQHPVISLNAAQHYQVTLIATNPMGSDVMVKSDLINAIDYGSPNSAFPPVLDGTDFGISRVSIKGAYGSMDTSTALKYPTYTRMNNLLNTQVYRGGTYQIDVYRLSAKDPMTLRIWADYNRDADYTDSAETILSEDSQTKIKTSLLFTVPATAAIGNTRILIGACNNMSLITPSTASVGVFEDFGMQVLRDQVKPVIQLNGSQMVNTEVGRPYIDSGASATDNIEGDVSHKIVVRSNVDTEVMGIYTIQYFVSDLYGNYSDTLVRTVQVVFNQSGPSLTLMGNDTESVEVWATYNEPGWLAWDHQHTDISSNVQVTGHVDTRITGLYTLSYLITDAFGMTAQKTRVVRVVDIRKPVILPYQDTNLVEHQIGTAFDDSRYVQVSDNYDEQLLPIRVSGQVNTLQVGTYTLVYRAIDHSGNRSDDFILHVRVTNKVPPHIVLVGSGFIELNVFGQFNDLGAVASDFMGRELVCSNNLRDKLRLDSIGVYTITYTATDEFGLTDSVTRTVRVSDLESPVIEILGDNPFVQPLGKPYLDPGIKVTDNYDEAILTSFSRISGKGIKVIIDSSHLNPYGAGFYYTVYINAWDAAGNQAEEKKRIVYVTLTGIEDQLPASGYSIFPNPATTTLTISCAHENVKKLRIFDVRGQEMKVNEEIVEKVHKLNIGNFGSGLYFIRIEGYDGSIYNDKFNVNK